MIPIVIPDTKQLLEYKTKMVDVSYHIINIFIILSAKLTSEIETEKECWELLYKW